MGSRVDGRWRERIVGLDVLVPLLDGRRART